MLSAPTPGLKFSTNNWTNELWSLPCLWRQSEFMPSGLCLEPQSNSPLAPTTPPGQFCQNSETLPSSHPTWPPSVPRPEHHLKMNLLWIWIPLYSLLKQIDFMVPLDHLFLACQIILSSSVSFLPNNPTSSASLPFLQAVSVSLPFPFLVLPLKTSSSSGASGSK